MFVELTNTKLYLYTLSIYGLLLMLIVICSQLKKQAKKMEEKFPPFSAYQKRLIFLKPYFNCLPTFLNLQ